MANTIAGLAQEQFWRRDPREKSRTPDRMVTVFSKTAFAWWWYPVLILLPDLGMLGYGLKFSDSFHHTHLGWLKAGSR